MMTHSIRRYVILGMTLLAVGAGLFGFSFLGAGQDGSADGVLRLVRPAFAAEDAVQRLNDVGVSAYLNTGQTINLADLNGTFVVVEDQTSNYIIGSISLPNYEDQQDEIFHAHAYVSTDGWIMIYFMDDAPASKIIDWKAYVDSGGSSINTLLEVGMRKVANDAGVAYEQPAFYDFRNPNATHLMLVADNTFDSLDSFRIELPSNLVYYETSYSIFQSRTSGNDYVTWGINDTNLVNRVWTSPQVIFFGSVDMATDEEYTISVTFPGGLAVVYKE